MNIDPHILVIDDEVPIQRLLNITLTNAGYHISVASTGKEGLQMASTHPPEMIILDLGLPDADGKEILQQLREWFKAPVIILSARDSEDEIVHALDLGANDYLVKPFRTGELMARIRNSFRQLVFPDQNPVLEVAGITIDFTKRIVLRNSLPVKLTATEFSLLALLAKNSNKVLTHQYILKEVWGPSYIGQSQYLRVFIGHLRKKLEDDPNQPTLIMTEPYIGYRFAEE